MSEWGRLQDALHDEFDRQGVDGVDVDKVIEHIVNLRDFFPGLLGAAPRAEGLDYGEIWARWEEFADMAARSGSGFTQDQITGAAAMLTWLIDHEDRSIR